MPAKISSRDRNKKLTDFYAKIPSSASSPALAAATGSMSITQSRPATRALPKAFVNRESLGAPSPIRSTSTMSTRKRARSPDDLNPSLSPLPPTKSKSAKKVSNPKRPAVVIRITSPFSDSSSARRPTPAPVHKTLVAPPLDSSEQVVYSSQSDEAELVLPIPGPLDLEGVVEDVHAWRRKTFGSSDSSSPQMHEDAIEVDLFQSSPLRSSPLTCVSSASPPLDPSVRSTASSTAPKTPVVASTCLSSALDTNAHPPLPPTPEPIDPETKTAKIIAEIKAKAFAENESSDDGPLLFRELEDSDDDDLIGELPLISRAKKQSSLHLAPRTGDLFSSPLSSAPSTTGYRTPSVIDLASPSLRPARVSTRTRKLAPAFHLPRIVSPPANTTKSLPPNRKKSAETNPLFALLREKRLQDKRGTSSSALRLAEEAAGRGTREASTGSDNDEIDSIHQLHLADEQAAWKAVHEFRKSVSPIDSGNTDDVTSTDCASKMLGNAAGEAINKILSGDRDCKGKEKAQDTGQKTKFGVSLWIHPSDEDMNVDSAPNPPLSDHLILTCLDGFFRDGDDSMLDFVLRTGALGAVPRDILLQNMPQLLTMALLASSQVSDAFCIALRDLWGLDPRAPRVQMPFVAIMSALTWLGANPTIFEELGLIKGYAQKSHISRETLLNALKRLLTIVKTAGLAGALASVDLPNVVLSLVIIGLDPLTSGELRTQLNTTMDVVCNCSATDDSLHDIHERVLNFVRQQVPINKAWLVSFFASGSGRTRRIAQRLAYCLLVSVSITPNQQALPLDPLILLISPEAGSSKLFDVTNESTDYDNLVHYVNILSVALIDITPYIEEERAATRGGSSTPVHSSPGKSKKLQVPPLELLRKILEVLQSKIVDTRAAHLDRSRTKAAIQRLTMRINYDRMALIGIRPRQRASTLKAYFSPQCP